MGFTVGLWTERCPFPIPRGWTFPFPAVNWDRGNRTLRFLEESSQGLVHHKRVSRTPDLAVRVRMGMFLGKGVCIGGLLRKRVPAPATPPSSRKGETL